jgi:16S rRNA (cytosine1402-N4)-methyltransferase
LLPNAWPRSPEPHVPVLADEVRELLAVRRGDTVVDCTFGAGGHATLLATDLGDAGRFVAIDRDPDTAPYLEAFRRRLPAGVDLRALHGPFSLCLRNLLATGEHADAVLLDLGISSMQVDRVERGFSYAHDAPLDMRMDPASPLTAAEIVNEWDEREISRVLWQYGEERFARQIARSIVRRRRERPYLRTFELVETVKGAIPTPSRFGHGHPAKRVFQGLRIAVNDELGELERALDHALELLHPGGRIAVITFHSLEDRMVKHRFREAARGCVCPPDFPVCACGRQPDYRVVNARPIRPGRPEVEINPRSASAKLRVAQREVPA